MVENPSSLILSGCLHPQPSSMDSPQRFTLVEAADT
jgi:hypothetical protein